MKLDAVNVETAVLGIALVVSIVVGLVANAYDPKRCDCPMRFSHFIPGKVVIPIYKTEHVPGCKYKT